MDTNSGMTRLVKMQGGRPVPRFEHQMLGPIDDKFCVLYGGVDTRIGEGHAGENMNLLAFGLPTEIPESLQEKRRLEAKGWFV